MASLPPQPATPPPSPPPPTWAPRTAVHLNIPAAPPWWRPIAYLLLVGVVLLLLWWGVEAPLPRLSPVENGLWAFSPFVVMYVVHEHLGHSLPSRLAGSDRTKVTLGAADTGRAGAQLALATRHWGSMSIGRFQAVVALGPALHLAVTAAYVAAGMWQLGVANALLVIAGSGADLQAFRRLAQVRAAGATTVHVRDLDTWVS